jgi:MraZ protein
MEVEADKQGRVLIPAKLREYAGIEKDVMIIGVGERVEIWDEEAWKEYYDEADSNYEELAEKLVDYDL